VGRKITVPMGEIMPNHLEFEVLDRGKTFSVLERVAGRDTPFVEYTGFPTREEAERFVLAQPEPWE
jgi:hypothetical protein